MTVEFKKVTARVILTLEIDVADTWGEDCSIKQIHDQATQTAVGMIRQIQDKNPPWMRMVRVIGTPKIDAVIATRENV